MIRKLLIANRGEIASRVIRSARALDIASVAVFSTPDADAPYVAEADSSVALPNIIVPRPWVLTVMPVVPRAR